MFRLKKRDEEYFIEFDVEIIASTKLKTMEQYLQHGKTNCLEHSIAVAYYSYWFVTAFRIQCDMRSLIRGSLLHDYFLYDWHKKDKSHSLHGFHHPKRALENAQRDTTINEIEADMIKHHMFPLTIIPPRSKEAFVLCFIDKVCSIYELRRRKRYLGICSLVEKI